MSVLDPLLVEILQALRIVKVNTIDLLGPLAPIVTGAGQITAAAIAIFFFITGRGFFAPPTSALKNYPTRISGVVAGCLIVGLYVLSRSDPSVDLLIILLGCLGVGLLSAVLYLFLYLTLSFRCDGDPTLYVRGLRLRWPARRVLQGQLQGLPPQYALPQYLPPHNLPTPSSSKEYFCKSGKDPDFIWVPASHALSQILLFIGYFLALVPLTLSLASGSLALTQLEVRETQTETRIELPADVLFNFGESKIRDAAIPSLEKTAELLRQRKVRRARIEGHTDSRGDEAFNQRLSIGRADAVRTWLASQEGLDQIELAVKGFGKTQPIAPNTNPDGSDNPNGRLRNRRVSIVIDRIE
jgi:outer membrane protein OmpA-like peptidoglycan-associated protein